MKIPNGIVTSDQLNFMAGALAKYGENDEACVVDITTRQNLQLRGLKVRLPVNIPSAVLFGSSHTFHWCAYDRCPSPSNQLDFSNGEQLEDTSELITGLVDRGLGCYMSGLDNVRNVVGNPMAGIDPMEDYDTRQLWYVIFHREREGGVVWLET